jgi:hypothetical protein
VPPGTHIENKVAAEGDSISVYAPGNYTGLYDNARANVTVCGLAVGGSDIERVKARVSGVTNCNGEVVTLLIGANDLYNGQMSVTVDMWLAKVWAYTDSLRAQGYKVAVGTILPQHGVNGTAYIAEFTADAQSRTPPSERRLGSTSTRSSTSRQIRRSAPILRRKIPLSILMGCTPALPLRRRWRRCTALSWTSCSPSSRVAAPNFGNWPLTKLLQPSPVVLGEGVGCRVGLASRPYRPCFARCFSAPNSPAVTSKKGSTPSGA